ncbi:hypothetical protein OM076_18505 [Solirubrobacter ginsenosidimutans]|uniref:Uncharacterized protein n=2 Tax=Solirubrobacter ginsenosidimutans TaxID=490573 RepID=A0A9X3S3M9_9ACTN|nr:hypothetical protein [Solirubrobacter ginsenosidimutans]
MGASPIGYKPVEHAGFGTLTAAQFKAALDQNGLRATSGHQGIPQPWDEAAWRKHVADAVTIGQRNIVNPASPITYFQPDGNLANIKGLTTAAAWHAYAADLNKAGAIARQSGLKFGFHIDFARIFKAAGNPRQHEYIIERDDAGATALTTAKVGYDFLSAIRSSSSRRSSRGRARPRSSVRARSR